MQEPNLPQKYITLTANPHRYLENTAPAFSRGKPSDSAELWLDTKINYLNEIMKFLPRTVTNVLTNHAEGEAGVEKHRDKDEYGESLYNKAIFDDRENGLWRGANSNSLNNLFGDTLDIDGSAGTDTIGSGRFTGLAGVPYEGGLSIGTNDGRELSIEAKLIDPTDGLNEYAGRLMYKTITDRDEEYDLDSTTGEKIIPILSTVTGDEHSASFVEGVNFHPTLVDMQHTVGTYDTDSGNFLVDMDGDGFADNDLDKNGKIENSELSDNTNVSNKAIDTDLYYSDYLSNLGVTAPIVDYSETFKSLMDQSLFSTSNIDDLSLKKSDRYTYYDLTKKMDGTSTGDFSNFLDKIKFAVNTDGSTTMDYIPNIYEIARKNIDISDGAVWSDQDVFYLSMLMMESRRRYTQSMSQVFGVNSTNLDMNQILSSFANPDFWQYEERESLLYFDVKTSKGEERMYNYFIPDDIGEDIPDDVSDYENKRLNAKTNWLKRRAIEFESYRVAQEVYSQSLSMSIQQHLPMYGENFADLTGLIGSDSQESLDGFKYILSSIREMIAENKMDNYMANYFLMSAEDVKRRLAYEIYTKSSEDLEYFVGLEDPPYTLDDFFDMDNIVLDYNYKNKENNKIDSIRGLFSLIDSSLETILSSANDLFVSDITGESTDPLFEQLINEKLANGEYELDETIMGDYMLEDKDAIIFEVTNTLNLIAQNQNNDIGSLAEQVTDIAGTYSQSRNMLDLLANIVDKKGRVFRDITQVNEFNRLNYGTVFHLADSDRTIHPLAEYGASDIGYYPNYIARNGYVSPYMSEAKRPMNATADGVSVGNSSTDANPLDKIYLDMIYQMQKMNTFYMMQSFSSPTNADFDGINWIGVDGDIVDREDLELNFMTPLKTIKDDLGGVMTENFSSSTLFDDMEDARTYLPHDYVEDQLLAHMGGSVSTTYYSGTYASSEVTLVDGTDDDDINGTKVMDWLIDVFDCGLDGSDFNLETGQVLETGITKIKEDNPLGMNVDNLQSMITFNVGINGGTASDIALVDLGTGYINSSLFNTDGTHTINFSPLNPFAINDSDFFSDGRKVLPNALKGMYASSLLEIVKSFYDESGSWGGTMNAPDGDFVMSMGDTSFMDGTALEDTLISAGIIAVDVDATDSFVFEPDALTMFQDRVNGVTTFMNDIHGVTDDDNFPDGTSEDMQSLFWQPLFYRMQSYATTGVDFTGETNSIISSSGMMSNFFENRYTVTDPATEGSDDPEKITVGINYSNSAYQDNVAHVQTIVDESIKADYDNISSFLIKLNERLTTLDFSAVPGKVSVNTSDNKTLLTDTILSLLPAASYNTTHQTYVNDFDYETTRNAFVAGSLLGDLAGGASSFKKAVSATSLTADTSLDGDPILDAFKAYNYIDSTNKPTRNIKIEDFPLIYGSDGAFIDILESEKEQILINYRKSYLGYNSGSGQGFLYNIIEDIKNIEFNTDTVGTLNMNIDKIIEDILCNDDFINTLEILQWCFSLGSTQGVSDLLALSNNLGLADGTYGVDHTRSLRQDGTFVYDFINEATGSANYSIADTMSLDSALRQDGDSLFRLLDKWDLDTWSFDQGEWDLDGDGTLDPYNTTASYQSVMKHLSELSLKYSELDLTIPSNVVMTGDGPDEEYYYDEYNFYQWLQSVVGSSTTTGSYFKNDISDGTWGIGQIFSNLGNFAYNHFDKLYDAVDGSNLNPTDSISNAVQINSPLYNAVNELDFFRSFNFETVYSDAYDPGYDFEDPEIPICSNCTGIADGFDTLSEDIIKYEWNLNCTAKLIEQDGTRYLESTFEGIKTTMEYTGTQTWTWSGHVCPDLDGSGAIDAIADYELKESETDTSDGTFIDKTTLLTVVPDGATSVTFDDEHGAAITLSWDGSGISCDFAKFVGTYDYPEGDEGVDGTINLALATRISGLKYDEDVLANEMLRNYDYTKTWVKGQLLSSGSSVDDSIGKDQVSFENFDGSHGYQDFGIVAQNDITNLFDPAATTDPAVLVLQNTVWDYLLGEGWVGGTEVNETVELLTESDLDGTYGDYRADILRVLKEALGIYSLDMAYYGDNRDDYYRAMQDELMRDFAGRKFHEETDAKYIEQITALRDRFAEYGLKNDSYGAITSNSDLSEFLRIEAAEITNLTGGTGEDAWTYLYENGFVTSQGYFTKEVLSAADLNIPADHALYSDRDTIFDCIEIPANFYVTDTSNKTREYLEDGDDASLETFHLHAYRAVDGSERTELELFYDGTTVEDAASLQGIADLCDTRYASTYDVCTLVKEQFDEINFMPNIYLDKYNLYRDKIIKAVTTGMDGPSLSAMDYNVSTVEAATKKAFMDEFYMRGEYSKTMLSREYQDRFNYSAQKLDYYEGEIIGQGNQAGWYETSGRFLYQNSGDVSGYSENPENPSNKFMDFANMNYDIETDIATQVSRSSKDSNSDLGKLSRKNIGTKRQRKAEDYYGRMSSYDGTVDSSFGEYNVLMADLKDVTSKGEYYKVYDIFYNSSGGERTETERNSIIDDLFTKLEISTLISSNGDEWKITETDGTTFDFGAETAFETFRDNASLWPDEITSVKSKYQIFNILKNPLWYANRIGANNQVVHNFFDMNKYYMEETWARMMILQFNDLNTDSYEKEEDEYTRNKKKYDDEQWSLQVAAANAQKRKAYLKSLRNKR